MNKRRVDDLIPQLIDYINDNNNKIKNSENKIPREFNGYISNFGASIVQSGLLATVAFFSSDNANSNRDRKLLMSLILNIIKEKEKKDENDTLLNYIIDNKDKIDLIKEEIIDIAVATKLAIRVFEFTEESSEEVNS
jgi:CRISPR-associated protein Cmr5